MSLQVFTHCVTHTASFANEDICASVGASAWILDGATSISGRRRTVQGRGETDASWFVTRFSQELAERADRDLVDAAPEILGVLRAQATGAWGGFGDTDVPSASLLHVAMRGRGVRLSNLGDCRLLYRVDGAPVASFGSCGVARLDSALLAAYRELRASDRSLTHSQAAQALVPMIRENRTLMNTPQGYWILEPAGAGLPHVQQLDVPFEREFQALLSTDGLYRLVDTYGVRDDHSFFEDARSKSGLDAMLAQLRAIEQADPDAQAHPRVKLQDDATAIFLELRRA